MNYSITLIFLITVLSYQAHAKKWKTIFPTEQEIEKMDKSYVNNKITVQNYYYPKMGKFNEVLSLRVKASKVLKEFGLKSGQVMVARMTTDTAKGTKGEIAPIIWRVEYQSLKALKAELKTFTPKKSLRFKKEILDKVRPLLKRFKRTSNYIISE